MFVQQYETTQSKMTTLQNLEEALSKRPTKAMQHLAMEQYDALEAVLKELNEQEETEIEVAETGAKIKLPFLALRLLANIMQEMGRGNGVSVIPVAAEVTTQAAAEILGCSRPHVIKLLEEGKINFTKVGRHRRIKVEDVMEYRKQQKHAQKEFLIQMMKEDEELGLYEDE
jgi:excisionase family DNA binding protein